MLKLTLIYLIQRGIPEDLIFMWASYILTKTSFNFKRYVFSSLVFALGGYLIRLLPIGLGINTFLCIPLMIYFNFKINKIPLRKSISVSILIFIIESFSEIINILVFQYGLNLYVTKNVMYSIPSLILSVVIVLIISYFGKIGFISRKKYEKLKLK